MKIPAIQIKKLRKLTGIGIMDCKEALINSNGNLDKAINFLRKKGENIATKRSFLEVKEGALHSSINDDQTFGVIIGLSCETDFLSKNKNFLDFLSTLSKISLLYHTKKKFLSSLYRGRTIQDLIIEKMGVVGEKMELKIFERIESPFVTGYIHNNRKIATLVGFSNHTKGINKTMARDISMHITAMNPIAIDEKEIPDSIVEKEKEIISYQVEKENKPSDIKKKIILGKVRKFILENTLLNQKFIKDNKITIREYMNKFNKNLKVQIYKRITFP
ncbi:translation elongation factor Ts [Blattabacterium cuenoti]|uniref:translation elongation factor Ts n=1 Tax=Blattabacterium cuenoti TaxID=1653831 RepID=UPI00163C482B|nr:translation elongation factor Ts [Blattabacterium cuenoti]